MRKRLIVFSSLFGSMLLLCMAVVSVSALVDHRSLLVSIAVMLTGLLLIFAQFKYIQRDADRYLQQLGDKIGILMSDDVVNHPLPVFAVGEKGEIVWYNKRAADVCGEDDEHMFGRMITTVFGEVDFKQASPEKGINVRLKDRMYSMFVNRYKRNGDVLYALYLVDDTDFKHYTDQYFKTRAAVMRIMIDNYEELAQSAKESETTHMLSEIDYQISKFAEKYKGLLYKMEKDRYIVVFEDQYMQQIMQGKLEILDTVRNIIVSDRVPPTLSIGIGRNAASIQDTDDAARQALDMAQGRGGDQAAVRTKNGYDFYGGMSKGVEKRTKVKTRIVATALSELIESSENVVLMGHRFADLDCFGSAIALHKAVTLMGKPAWIAIDPEKNLVETLYEKLLTEGYEGVFKRPEELFDSISDNTLLIVVDTHAKQILESRELYEKCKNVAVIDHHRKLVDYIENATIFYHEPYASSASEMIAELVQYLPGGIKLTRIEAEALLAGIMLDTKNFILKTGVRTFEAAAYLRRLGADTVEVRKLFSSSMDAYQRRSRLVASAEIYSGCAISSSTAAADDIGIVAPQAADELLSISNVDASFVMYESGKGVNISARSLGEMNVQIIMEYLGGGGHLNMAAAQLENCSMETARQKLLEAIDQYRETNSK